MFRPIAKKKPSAKKSHGRPNVAIQQSFRSTRTKKVVKSYPPDNLSSGVHYHPIHETRPQHDVHLGQYDPFEPGVHVSHSQVQPRLVRVEAPPHHVEVYHPEQAHKAFFTEKSFRHPPDSYERYFCSYYRHKYFSISFRSFCAFLAANCPIDSECLQITIIIYVNMALNVSSIVHTCLKFFFSSVCMGARVRGDAYQTKA